MWELGDRNFEYLIFEYFELGLVIIFYFILFYFLGLWAKLDNRCCCSCSVFLLKFQICSSVKGKIFFWYNGGVRGTFLIDWLPNMQCFSMLCTCFFACAKAWRIKMILHPLCDKIFPYLFINSQFFPIARDLISTYSMKGERERAKTWTRTEHEQVHLSIISSL
jgi:hypothetical protein